MNYKIEKLANEPIDIWIGYKDFKWGTPEQEQCDAELEALWEASPELVYHIADTTQMVLDIDQLMKSSAHVAYGQQALWTHPKLKLVIVVSQDPAIIHSIELLNQSLQAGKGVYQQVPVMVMTSVEAAIAYAREQVRQDRHVK